MTVREVHTIYAIFLTLRIFEKLSLTLCLNELILSQAAQSHTMGLT